jgi:DNA-binding NtrC family response regulator
MSATSRRLLIVDDEPLILDLLRDHFTPSYRVETVSNGDEALTAVRREPPDIVLLDIRMPRMSGMDVLKDITAIDSTITVIMITALEHVTLAAEAIEHGAASYVLKPFDLRRLDAVVAETLASRPRRDRAR